MRQILDDLAHESAFSSAGNELPVNLKAISGAKQIDLAPGYELPVNLKAISGGFRPK